MFQTFSNLNTINKTFIKSLKVQEKQWLNLSVEYHLLKITHMMKVLNYNYYLPV